VFFTNKRAPVKTNKRHLVVRRKILILEHIEGAKYFHSDTSVKSRLAKCVGLLVKNTNKGEQYSSGSETRRISHQTFPRREAVATIVASPMFEFWPLLQAQVRRDSRDVLITSTQRLS